MNELILFSHPTFGVLGTMAALWVFVEALNASDSNRVRTLLAALAVTTLIGLACAAGGYWYVFHYAPEKTLILSGPWPFAHGIVMETKEHLFFVLLILAVYLPIVAARRLVVDRPARIVAIVVAGLIVLHGLAIEGAGAIINHGAKAALAQAVAKGSDR
jgi:hypothetical protein